MSKKTAPRSRTKRAQATPTRRRKAKLPQARHDAFAWQDTFLAALRRDPNVSAAARKAHVTRQYVYEVRATEGKKDEALTAAKQFAAAWDDAIEEALDTLEAEARRRALNGLPRKKFTGKGEAVIDPATGKQYVEHEYSDALMQFLLRVRRYGEKKHVEVTGKDGAPIQVEDIEQVRARRWAQVSPALARVLVPSDETTGEP